MIQINNEQYVGSVGEFIHIFSEHSNDIRNRIKEMYFLYEGVKSNFEKFIDSINDFQKKVTSEQDNMYTKTIHSVQSIENISKKYDKNLESSFNKLLNTINEQVSEHIQSNKSILKKYRMMTAILVILLSIISGSFISKTVSDIIYHNDHRQTQLAELDRSINNKERKFEHLKANIEIAQIMKRLDFQIDKQEIKIPTRFVINQKKTKDFIIINWDYLKKEK